MKKILFTVGLWCLALCVQADGHISRLRAELQDSRSDYVFVVAHRGDWRHAPENSVAAIKGAADMGVDMVEIDIQRTKDGGFVLMHDGSIDRTTEGKGNVADYTVEELKRFRLRRADGNLSDETIPTLEEALTACKGAVLVNIDKGGDYLSEIAPIIRKTGTEDHVVLKGRGTVEEVERQLSGYKDILYMPVVDLDGEGAIPTPYARPPDSFRNRICRLPKGCVAPFCGKSPARPQICASSCRYPLPHAEILPPAQECRNGWS